MSLGGVTKNQSWKNEKKMFNHILHAEGRNLSQHQRYTYRVLQRIQMKVILLWVWAERAVLGRAKTALKFKYEI